MSITQEQKNIVQNTFAMVADADALAARFYERLFEIDTTTRVLFKEDMTEQRQKLMQTLAVVVNSLNNLEGIVPAIQSLAERHVDYGVTVAHWDSVGAALLWTLADTFGDAFTEEVHAAWAAAYNTIKQVALEAAYPHTGEAIPE